MTRLVLLATLVLAACGATDPQAPVAEAGDEASVTYVCPMHPDVTSTDAEATCPTCGMDLVAKAHDEADHTQHGH